MAAAIGISNQRMHENAAIHRANQSTFNFRTIKAKNDNFDAVIRFVDGIDQGLKRRSRVG